MESVYLEKYLKYKSKYLELKEQLGGEFKSGNFKDLIKIIVSDKKKLEDKVKEINTFFEKLKDPKDKDIYLDTVADLENGTTESKKDKTGNIVEKNYRGTPLHFALTTNQPVEIVKLLKNETNLKITDSADQYPINYLFTPDIILLDDDKFNDKLKILETVNMETYDGRYIYENYRQEKHSRKTGKSTGFEYIIKSVLSPLQLFLKKSKWSEYGISCQLTPTRKQRLQSIIKLLANPKAINGYVEFSSDSTTRQIKIEYPFITLFADYNLWDTDILTPLLPTAKKMEDLKSLYNNNIPQIFTNTKQVTYNESKFPNFRTIYDEYLGTINEDDRRFNAKRKLENNYCKDNNSKELYTNDELNKVTKLVYDNFPETPAS